MSSLGHYHTTLPYFAPKAATFGQKVLKIHASINMPIPALNVRESREFPRHIGNWSRVTRQWRQISHRKLNKAVSRMRIEKYAIPEIRSVERGISSCPIAEFIIIWPPLSCSVHTSCHNCWPISTSGLKSDVLLEWPNRPTVVTWTLNDSVGHNGLSYTGQIPRYERISIVEKKRDSTILLLVSYNASKMLIRVHFAIQKNCFSAIFSLFSAYSNIFILRNNDFLQLSK